MKFTNAQNALILECLIDSPLAKHFNCLQCSLNPCIGNVGIIADDRRLNTEKPSRTFVVARREQLFKLFVDASLWHLQRQLSISTFICFPSRQASFVICRKTRQHFNFGKNFSFFIAHSVVG